MLQRISADRFATPAGQRVQLVLRSSQNNGINSGAFHYAGLPLPSETIQGLPGCTFLPVEGVQQFRVNVNFDPAAASARYDLFEIDQANGSQIDLNEHRLASDPDGIIGFGISGTPVGVLVSAKKAAKKKKKAAKKSAKKAVKAKTAKKAKKGKTANKATKAKAKKAKKVKKAKKR